MANVDAEWVDVDNGLVPLNPRLTTTTFIPPTSTFRPLRPRPGGRRPRGPGPRGPQPPHELPDTDPSTSSSASMPYIIAGVVSGVLLLALVMLMLYLLLLRKKLKKVTTERNSGDFSLRVEDVAHLTQVNESDPIYANTTDLQMLLSTVRKKTKHPQTQLPLNKERDDPHTYLTTLQSPTTLTSPQQSWPDVVNCINANFTYNNQVSQDEHNDTHVSDTVLAAPRMTSDPSQNMSSTTNGVVRPAPIPPNIKKPITSATNIPSKAIKPPSVNKAKIPPTPNPKPTAKTTKSTTTRPSNPPPEIPQVVPDTPPTVSTPVFKALKPSITIKTQTLNTPNNSNHKTIPQSAIQNNMGSQIIHDVHQDANQSNVALSSVKAKKALLEQKFKASAGNNN